MSSDFVKYQHLERYGHRDVAGIENGISYVFPKLDGTNGVVWLQDGEVVCGSRNRKLSKTEDNAGFYQFVRSNRELSNYLHDNPTHRLYGEWLVPHTLKTYQDNAWRKFYVFDIVEDGDKPSYIPYGVYETTLKEYRIDYIPLLRVVINGSYEEYESLLNLNTFLIKDGKGIGEGVVIKNYDFVNCFGRTTWAKIVANEFKENHVGKSKHTPQVSRIAEEVFVETFVTKSFCEKEWAKFSLNGVDNKTIGVFLAEVCTTVIREELADFVTKNKNTTINFRTLNGMIVQKAKEHLPEVFGR